MTYDIWSFGMKPLFYYCSLTNKVLADKNGRWRKITTGFGWGENYKMYIVGCKAGIIFMNQCFLWIKKNIHDQWVSEAKTAFDNTTFYVGLVRGNCRGFLPTMHLNLFIFSHIYIFALYTSWSFHVLCLPFVIWFVLLHVDH